MPWVRLDDQFPEHPKVAEAGPLAVAMHVAALCYSARNLTDGRIPKSVAKKLLDLDGIEWTELGQSVDWSDLVFDLIDAGMWTETDDGYEIHDYLDFQPSRREVEARRQSLHEKRSEAGRKGAEARWGKAPGQNGKHGTDDSERVADEKQTDDPVPVPGPPSSSPPPTELPAVRWARRWAEVSGIPFTAAVRRAWVPKVQDFIGAGGTPSEALMEVARRRGIESPGGWGFIDSALVDEEERVGAHRDCEKCDGKGYVEDYSPGGGMFKVPCSVVPGGEE